MTMRGLAGRSAIAALALGCTSPSVRLGDETGAGGSGTPLENASGGIGSGGTGTPVGDGGAGSGPEYVERINDGQLQNALANACQGETVEWEPGSPTLPCVYSIQPPGEGALDPELVWISFTDQAGVMYGMERNDGTVCDRGWHYTADGSQIEICGQTCARVEQASEVILVYGCELGLAPGQDTGLVSAASPGFAACAGAGAEPESDVTTWALPCVFPVVSSPEPLEPELVLVTFTDTTGSTYEVRRNFGQVCDRGWHYSADGSQIEICGETCEKVQHAGKIDVLFGCQSGLAPAEDIVGVSTERSSFEPCQGEIRERDPGLPSWPFGCFFSPGPTLPPATLDPELVWITFVDPTGAIYQVQRNDALPCLRGWHYAGDQIEICGDTCQDVQSSVRVVVQYGCISTTSD